MSMIQHFPEPPSPRGRVAGFTLIEILVALVISGLVVSAVFQVLQGNSRFVQMQSAREEVQQNARAALDLIAGDLRGVPPGAIMAMDAGSMRFYQPRAWGVLCKKLKPADNTAWVLFPVDVLPDADFWGRLHWGIGVEQTVDPLTHPGVFRFSANVTRQTSGDPCNAIQSNPSAPQVRLGFNRTSGSPFASVDSILPGTQVMLYEEVKYDVNAGGSVPGSWIRRMVGYTGTTPNMQPMAGPVPAAEALKFTYLKADGATAATTAADVRQIRVRVVTQSRASSVQAGVLRPQQVDTATTDVFLRNIPG